MSVNHLKIYARLPQTALSTIEQIKEVHMFYGPRVHVAFAGASDCYSSVEELAIALGEIRSAFPKYTIKCCDDWFLCTPFGY